MNYDFTDINETGVQDLESSNKLIYNGINVDDELSSDESIVTTLNISGRGLAQYKNNVKDIPGADGALFESSYLEPRTLEVEIQVTALNTDVFRQVFERMNKMFRTGYEVPIKFSDEMDATYYGIYVSSDTPKEDSNEQVITITINCSDPLKTTQEETIDYANSEQMVVDTDFPVKPYLEITFPEDTHEFKVHNTTQDLTVDYKRQDSFNTSIYHLKINENKIHRDINETEGYDGLVLSSDWEDFTVETDDQIVIQPEPQTIKIHYRGEKL